MQRVEMKHRRIFNFYFSFQILETVEKSKFLQYCSIPDYEEITNVDQN